mgnify:CR=1 FL=1
MRRAAPIAISLTSERRAVVPDLAAEQDVDVEAVFIALQGGAILAATRDSMPEHVGNRLACALMRLFWGARYTDLGPFRDAFSRLRELVGNLGVRQPLPACHLLLHEGAPLAGQAVELCLAAGVGHHGPAGPLPADHAVDEVHDVVPLLGEVGDGPRGAAARLADHEGLRGLELDELAQARGQLHERDVYGALDVARRPLVVLAHVEDHQALGQRVRDGVDLDLGDHGSHSRTPPLPPPLPPAGPRTPPPPRGCAPAG